MKQISKDLIRVQRSTENAIARCEILLKRNLTFPNLSREQIIQKYKLIEFV